MLTEAKIRNTKPLERPSKLFDGGGLYLLLNPNGARWWRLKYRHGGKEQLLSLGVYPEVSLKEARARRDEHRKRIGEGKNPSVERKASKQRSRLSAAQTFKGVSEEWLQLQTKTLSPKTRAKAQWILKAFVYPNIGSLPISTITAQQVLALLRFVEDRGIHETAHRARSRISQVFRFAVATGRADRDVTADLRGALAPVPTKSYAAVTDPARVGALLRAIDSYSGYPASQAALRLAPLVFVRPGELRQAEWCEIDLDAAEWRIPADRMKMGELHIVPLATQAVQILRELQPVTGHWPFVFPSVRTSSRPMSDNTINAALRRLGYTPDEMTGHGFRALASTRLNEMGWSPDVIERQLAHAERNKVRAAYNRASYMAERRKMMQAWADYLDGLKAGGKVIPIHRQG